MSIVYLRFFGGESGTCGTIFLTDSNLHEYAISQWLVPGTFRY